MAVPAQLGDAAARAALARAPTPSGGASPCCGGWPTRTPATPAPLRVVVAAGRAACCSRVVRRARRPRAGPPGRGRPRPSSTALIARLVDLAYARVEMVARARRVRRARRHPRRLPADRRAPGAGRVLGRRGRRSCAASPSPTSARCPATADARPWSRRRAASCCSPPTVRGAGAAQLAAEHPDAVAELLEQARRGHPGRGHGVAAPGARRRRAASCSLTELPAAGAHVLVCRPGADPDPRPRTSSRTGQEFLEASWSPRRPAAARRRSTWARRRYRDLDDVRDARRAGAPWCDPVGHADGPVRRGRDRDDGPRARRPASTARRVLPRRHRPRGRRPARRCADIAGGVGAASSCRPRHGRSARPSCCRARGRRRRAVERPRRRAARPAWPRRAAGRCADGFSWPAAGSPCSPRPTSTGAAAAATTERAQARAAAAAQRRRPAAAQAGRLRRARPARHRPVRRDGAAHRRRRRDRASTWCSSTRRPSAASPATGCSCPTDQLDQRHPLRRRRGAAAEQDGRQRLGQDEGPGAQGGPRDRGASSSSSTRAPRPRPGTRSAPDTPWQRELEDAFPFAETPGPALGHRRGQGRHGAAGADGPA